MASRERAVIESLLMIPNKDGVDVPFIHNSAQIKLDEALTGRDVIPKARQEGVSSLILGKFTIRCLHKRNTRAVVISHDKESTERLFARVKYFLENIRGPKPVTGLASKREFTFPKTNSMFYIGTAGARKFGRGDTITDLHCSEIAFWEDPKTLTAGLFQSVPRSGWITLESTGNGRNWYYRRVNSALKDRSKYTVHFLDWLSFTEYDWEVTDEEAQLIVSSLDPDLEEDILFYETGLTPGQLQFRREKLDEMDFDLMLFKQEYPITLEECFRATGKSIFHKVNYVQTPLWERRTHELWALKNHPKPGGKYGLGSDIGGGVGSDNSIAEIVDLDEMRQVGELASDQTAPDVFATKLADIGHYFNDAYITVESNNHGITTLDNLRYLYPPHLIHKKPTTSQLAEQHILSLGLYQTSRTRPLALGTLRKLLATIMTIHSPKLKDELDTFVEKEDGKLEAEEGAMDDRVMAMAAFAHTHPRAMIMKADEPLIVVPTKDPFLLESIIEELHGRRKTFPIAPQVIIH